MLFHTQHKNSLTYFGGTYRPGKHLVELIDLVNSVIIFMSLTILLIYLLAQKRMFIFIAQLLIILKVIWMVSIIKSKMFHGRLSLP